MTATAAVIVLFALATFCVGLYINRKPNVPVTEEQALYLANMAVEEALKAGDEAKARELDKEADAMTFAYHERHRDSMPEHQRIKNDAIIAFLKEMKTYEGLANDTPVAVLLTLTNGQVERNLTTLQQALHYKTLALKVSGGRAKVDIVLNPPTVVGEALTVQ